MPVRFGIAGVKEFRMCLPVTLHRRGFIYDDNSAYELMISSYGLAGQSPPFRFAMSLTSPLRRAGYNSTASQT